MSERRWIKRRSRCPDYSVTVRVSDLSYPLDLDRSVDREKGRAHRKGIIGEASTVLEIVGEVVSAVVGLREDDDDV
jgi:hypothetical protein